LKWGNSVLYIQHFGMHASVVHLRGDGALVGQGQKQARRPSTEVEMEMEMEVEWRGGWSGSGCGTSGRLSRAKVTVLR